MQLKYSTVAIFALVLVLAAIPAAGQGDMADVEIETVEVAPGIHMLVGQGGNIGVSSGDDGVVLIDDQFAPLTEKIKAAVAAIDDDPIRFVLNTHYHGDHTGGNENLGKGGALIVAHDNVRERMSVDQFNAFFNRTFEASPAVALPVVTFTDSVTFHVNGEEVHVFHLPPAHTDGDAVVHFRRANVVHTGDLYFNGMYPFIDIWGGGTVDGYIAAAEKLLSLVDEKTKIIPGHGELSNKAELGAFVAMLKATRLAVASLVKEGKTLEETLAAKPTADYDEAWTGPFITPERWVRILYADLSGGA